MNITQVTVGWQQTQSLPSYSNIKPSLSLTAQLSDGDNVDLVIEQLRNQARGFVEAQIDDALEANEQPAKYSLDARYDVLFCRQLEVPLTAIVPHDSFTPKHFYRQHSGFRLAAAQRLAQANTGNRIEYLTASTFIELVTVEADLDAKDEVAQLKREHRYAEQQAAWKRAETVAAPDIEEEDDEEEEDEE